MDVVISLGTILIVGYFFGLVAEKFRLPRVTAYLLAGVLFSDEILGHLVNLDLKSWSETFSAISLGFIAYIVGGEVDLSKFKTNGKLVFRSTILSSFAPLIFVFLGFYLFTDILGVTKEMAFLFAALSTTTDAAAPIAIINQFQSKGELTETTIGVVALDDAVGIVVFMFFSVFFLSSGAMSWQETLTHELGLSIFIGLLMGLFLNKASLLSPSNDYIFPLLSGLILLSVGISEYFHTSTLLTCIIIGLTANNLSSKAMQKTSLMMPVEHIEDFVFITFFTLTGIHFSFSYFKVALIPMTAYVILRGLGKYVGAYLGCKISSPSDNSTSKFLGLTLLPQAGVAIGLVFQIIHLPEFRSNKELIFNIILGSTIIYEIFGSLMAKYSLESTGDIK
ncbi:MAG: hypothetical protein CME69_06695 [Halobacteriovorax sp.]|nr:hypothetical protein [Halobacteriovorax sp.]